MPPGAPEVLEPVDTPTLIEKEPIAILGVVLVVAQLLVTILGLGELKDGLQLGDASVILVTIIAFLTARGITFSPATVKLLAPPEKIEAAVAQRKRLG